MRLKIKLLVIAALFVFALPMVFPVGSVEANDSGGTVQGQVTLIDSCSGTVFIDNVPFDASSLDLSGMMGAYVNAMYSNTATGKVIKSIQVVKEVKKSEKR